MLAIPACPRMHAASIHPSIHQTAPHRTLVCAVRCAAPWPGLAWPAAQLVDEVRERREFLEAMRAAGKGGDYEAQVRRRRRPAGCAGCAGCAAWGCTYSHNCSCLWAYATSHAVMAVLAPPGWLSSSMHACVPTEGPMLRAPAPALVPALVPAPLCTCTCTCMPAWPADQG